MVRRKTGIRVPNERVEEWAPDGYPDSDVDDLGQSPKRPPSGGIVLRDLEPIAVRGHRCSRQERG